MKIIRVPLTPIADKHDKDPGSKSLAASTNFFTMLRAGFWLADPSHFSRNPDTCSWIQCWIRPFELSVSDVPAESALRGAEATLAPSVDEMPAEGGLPSELEPVLLRDTGGEA